MERKHWEEVPEEESFRIVGGYSLDVPYWLQLSFYFKFYEEGDKYGEEELELKGKHDVEGGGVAFGRSKCREPRVGVGGHEAT